MIGDEQNKTATDKFVACKQTDRDAIEEVRNFLSGYRYCMGLLKLGKHERRRAKAFDEPCDEDVLLAGDEVFWRARMYAVKSLIDSMKNGREKMLLHSRYIRGQSIEHISDMLGFSRRTGYRLHQKGLLIASILYQKIKKETDIGAE